MSKRKILLVGDHITTETWEMELAGKGFDCRRALTMIEAIDEMRKPENAHIPLLVQESLAIIPNERSPRVYPKEFDPDKLDQYDRGAALINYARKEGLIASETPAYLSVIEPTTMPPPHGVTKVIGLDTENLSRALEPPLHRPTRSSHDRRPS
jgi:hypothetical protein